MEILNFLESILFSVINNVLYGLSSIAHVVVGLLPRSPFLMLHEWGLTNEQMMWLNWLIPISEMVVISQTWLVAIGLYYLYSIPLRWVKAIK